MPAIKKKILVVIGTRPEAIKMAPVIKQLQVQSHCFDVKVCITAQHREMLDQVLELFKIKADYDLDIMRPNQDLFCVTTAIMNGLKELFAKQSYDLVLVHGDTTTTMAAALSAFYSGIPVGHVEAGLRTGNLDAPWPEEMNRRMTGLLTRLHFAPTAHARQNLLREGVADGGITVTGNTVIDALKFSLGVIRDDRLEEQLIHEIGSGKSDLCSMLMAQEKRLVLVTGHRRENFGAGFENICLALQDIVKSRKDIAIVYPVHLNPNVKEPVHRILGHESSVYLTSPLGYFAFTWLMNRSYLILSDSGGIQEEAPALGKPVLVMRDLTERTEAVEAGTVKLVGTDRERIVGSALHLLDCQNAYGAMASAPNPYGDGTASQKITNVLEARL